MEKIKYFFECYFNQAWDYCDLDHLIQKYKNIEQPTSTNALIHELHQAIKTNNYDYAIASADKFGGRIFNESDMKKFITYIYNRLLDLPTTIQANDFYSKPTFCPRCNIEPYRTEDSERIIEKAKIINKHIQIFICKHCKAVWLTEEIRADKAQDYKKFMQSLGLKGTWKELCDVDVL